MREEERMTYEEALKAIESLIRCAQFAQTDYADGVDGVLLDVCKEVLEKQIPKKPKEIKQFRNFAVVLCPCCEQHCVNDEMFYCDICGQKLDWSEE